MGVSVGRPPGPEHSIRSPGAQAWKHGQGQLRIRPHCSELHSGEATRSPATGLGGVGASPEAASARAAPKSLGSAPEPVGSPRARDPRGRRGAGCGGCRGGGSAGTAGPERLRGERRKEKEASIPHKMVAPTHLGATRPLFSLHPSPRGPGRRGQQDARPGPRRPAWAGARPSPPVAVGVAVRGGAGPAGAGAGRDSAASARGPAGHGRHTHLGRARGAGRGGGAAE